MDSQVHTISRARKPCIYGFTYNSECYYYGLYLCNFENVWKQEVDKQKLVHIAKTIGIEDMSDDDLVELINDISRYIPEKWCLSRMM